MINKLISFLIIAGLLAISVLLFVANTKTEPKLLSPILQTEKPNVILGVEDFPNSNNLWTPDKQITTNLPQPTISARSAIIIDLTSNQIVYAKNIHNKQPVASTVKIMTAALALERRKANEIFTVSAKAATVGEDSMGISEGEKYTLQEMLHGLMLPSGNDAAETIAENIAGSTEQFVALMNNKARLLGLKDTKFVNPSGLEEDGVEQYSTAYDLAVISRYAWFNFPLFRQVVGTKSYEIPYSQDHKYLYLENQTNLLSTYPGVKGIKPGFTPEAGLCLVTLTENGGHQLLGVILGSSDRRGEMIQLLDYSFASIGVKI